MQASTWALSNREAATAFWLAAAALWAVSHPAVRTSLTSLVKTAANWKLLAPVALFAAWIAGTVTVLSALGIWTPDLLKDTVTWFVVSGWLLLFSGIGRAAHDRGFWRRLAWDQVKVTAIFEWLTSTYTFGLGVELVLLPALFVVVTMDALAGTRPEFKSVGRITSFVIAAFGFYVVGTALGEAAGVFQFSDLGRDVRAIILGPILSLATLPLAYAMAVIAAMEMLAVRLSWSIDGRQDQGLPRYALWQVAARCRFNPRKIAQCTRVYLHRMNGSKSRQEIDDVILLSKSRKRGHLSLRDASGA
jgi:hypothetical protein